MTTISKDKTQVDLLIEDLDALGGLASALSTHEVRTSVLNQYRLSEVLQGLYSIHAGAHPWRLRVPAGLLRPHLTALDSDYDLDSPITGSFNAALTRPAIPGQVGRGNHNVVVLVQPYWYGDDNKFVAIEVGCRHSLEVANLGRCYNRHTCTKCGLVYEVDSGD